jgi:hypothetical protein
MSAHSMDVFSLRDAVVGEYQKFATSFTKIHAEDIRRQVQQIYAQNRYWPEPLIQINPNYKRTTTVESLVAAGTLDPRCAEIFRKPPSAESPAGEPLTLYKHQEQAIALASQGDSYVVTTGTGSGKSLCRGTSRDTTWRSRTASCVKCYRRRPTSPAEGEPRFHCPRPVQISAASGGWQQDSRT